jgi:hypothetical protein
MSAGRLLRRASAVALAVLVVGIAAAPAASASTTLPETVHTERVQVGPYEVTLGFSVWPVRAMRSLEFTFGPDGGIAGKSGTVTEVSPSGAAKQKTLKRHPRDRTLWGLDVHSVPDPGTWTYRFEIDGPQGHGTGEIRLDVLEQPGPPIAPMWAIGLIPAALAVTFLVTVWLRHRVPRKEELVPIGYRN